MAILGIDLGTTNSLACIYQNGRATLIPNGLGSTQTPSVVSLLEDETVLVGAAAKERQATHPKDTAASFKVWMGSERPITLGNRQFRPEELSSFVLRQLLQDAQQYLGEPVEEAVISVPAYFNDNQRCATKLAAQLAGLTVKRLINEPSAAALCHRQRTGGGDAWMMIVDFGGGTLDVSVVECFETIIEIIAIAGDNHLGGDDIDHAVVAHFCTENHLAQGQLPPKLLAQLYWQAESAKRALSRAEAAVIALTLDEAQHSLVLTRPLLRQICTPVLERVEAVIRRAVKDSAVKGQIDDIVLVGGSSQLPVLGDFLEELFGRRPAVAASPDEIVALGVGLCAGMKARAEDLQDLVMTDVCPFSLGVASYHSAEDRSPHMAVLIQRSSMLPTSHQEIFYTLHHNQTGLRFEIYQGEGYFVSENLKLGELEVQVPPGPAGEQWAQVRFTYDIDGLLHVAANSSGGDQRERLILNPKLQMNEEALAKATERLAAIRLSAQEQLQDTYLLEKALRLYEQAGRQTREEIQQLIGWYRTSRKAGTLIAQTKLHRQMQDKLDALEAELAASLPLDELWRSHEDCDNAE